MLQLFFFAIFLAHYSSLIECAPVPQQFPSMAQSHPVSQEANTNQLLASHHGFMYSPQPMATFQSATETSPPPLSSRAVELDHFENQRQQNLQLKANPYSSSDPDFQMLARSLRNGVKNLAQNQPTSSIEIPPCSSDGRSVTIDHLRISPDSLVQIARLAQTFGTNPDWKKLRLSDAKSALDTPMNPTHRFSSRSIGL